MAVEGYAYRTNARFGNRIRVAVREGTVTISGPRVSRFVYHLWIGVQVVLFWPAVPALLAAAILWDRRYLAAAGGLVVAHWAISTLGAVLIWAWADVDAMGREQDPTVTFPLSGVRDVRIGRGWARNGLWLVIPLFVPLIDRLSEGVNVSFEAPAGDEDGDVVYALTLRSRAKAQALAGLLRGGFTPT